MITKEKQLGVKISEELYRDEEDMKHNIETSQIKHLTIMGKAIGFAKGATLFVASDKLNYLNEAEELIKSKK